MAISPTSQEFEQVYASGEPQVVFTHLVADLETPVSAMLKLAHDAQYSFLLESVEGGAVRGRYSMIGMKPDLIWKVEGNKASVNRKALLDPEGPFEGDEAEPLQSLRNLLAETRIDLPETLPPMAAGLFGYIGYDMVRLMEELPPANPDFLEVPDALMIRPTVMAIFDAVKDEVTVITPVYPSNSVNATAAYARAVERLNDVIDALEQPLDPRAGADADLVNIEQPGSNTTPDEYKAMVERVKEYITAGDIFQAVLSQRFETEFPMPSFSLYRALRRVNPSPFL
jgi:anthranilate synthase component 1